MSREEIHMLMTDPENQPPQYNFNEDVKFEGCEIMECGWNGYTGKCDAGIIHIDGDGYPDKCE